MKPASGYAKNIIAHSSEIMEAKFLKFLDFL